MHAVIMAGGRGARFWPRSREKKPKHLLNILSDRTIIQETVDRLVPLVPPRNILIVTGKKHAAELRRQLPEIPARNILVEPVGRNTAACIGWAALHIQNRSKDDIMAVLPSDHAVGDPDRYRKVLDAAAAAAEKYQGLITIGVKPTFPHTGYGYIEGGTAKGKVAGETLLAVQSFREKPNLNQAKTFLKTGRFYWNSGIFVWRAKTILSEIEKYLPDLHAGLMTIQSAMGKPSETKTLSKVYQGLKAVSIDYGVMEKAKDVWVIPATFGWSDLGSWDALWDVSVKDEKGNAATGDSDALFQDSENSLVASPRKLVALIGMKDVLVVDTKDALLICKRGRSQDVKNVVDVLEATGKKRYL
jgi:mannose-1-phosphate guanylyltransferase